MFKNDPTVPVVALVFYLIAVLGGFLLGVLLMLLI